MKLDQFVSNGWRTPDTYVSDEFECIPDASGIYILVATNFDRFSCPIPERVAYVGQATRLVFRLRGHPVCRSLCGPRCHVSRWFKCFPLNQLRDVERQYIRLFDPPYNLQGRKRGWPSEEAA